MIPNRIAFTFVLVVAGVFLTGGAAAADQCGSNAQAGRTSIGVGAMCHHERQATRPLETSTGPTKFDASVWVSVCRRFSPVAPKVTLNDCGAARVCPSPGDRYWALWGRIAATGRWTLITQQCFGAAGPPGAARPQVTPAVVLNALRRIGLPALTAHTQPAGKTLVNFATIFYAEPQPFRRTVRLLGQRVDIVATPTGFTWHHGDGTSLTTTVAGRPYPATDITYDYRHAHVTVKTRVDVTYGARFRVNGGAWRTVNGTVTITGPAQPLRIAEAVPVLSGQHN
jgi:hypothetical protein